MAPTVLILGHSFVKRLKCDLQSQFDTRADVNFGLQGTASVFLYSVGGRSVEKVRSFDLPVVKQLEPDIVILELGTNDLVDIHPEVVGSQIESLVCLLLEFPSVHVVGMCHVIPRDVSHVDSMNFAHRVEILRQYLTVMLDCFPNVFCWLHKPFSHLAKDLYLADGVHVNSMCHYLLYQSYRGAILKSLGML